MIPIIKFVDAIDTKTVNTFETIYPLLSSALFAGIVQIEISGEVIAGTNYYNARLRYTKSLKIFCYTRADIIDDVFGNIEQALNHLFEV